MGTPTKLIATPVNQLCDQALEWSVAKALGHQPTIAESTGAVTYYHEGHGSWCTATFRHWGDAGPLIQHNGICLEEIRRPGMPVDWKAYTKRNEGGLLRNMHYDTDPVVAALRCMVEHRLGDTVQVPAELLPAKPRAPRP